jgi:hypothetical protein
MAKSNDGERNTQAQGGKDGNIEQEEGERNTKPEKIVKDSRSTRNTRGRRDTQLYKEERVDAQHKRNVQGTASSKKEGSRKIGSMKRRRYND